MSQEVGAGVRNQESGVGSWRVGRFLDQLHPHLLIGIDFRAAGAAAVDDVAARPLAPPAGGTFPPAPHTPTQSAARALHVTFRIFFRYMLYWSLLPMTLWLRARGASCPPFPAAAARLP